ncbi:MAG: hypothetical protein EA380_09585 [Phycisphaeraceae bacterium]|nr:MAG: hypothetical protein EA380_09585 [Phycisphaeraceae bacterium]
MRSLTTKNDSSKHLEGPVARGGPWRPIMRAGEWGRVMNGLNNTVGRLLGVGLIAGACGGAAFAQGANNDELLSQEEVASMLRASGDAFFTLNDRGTYVSEYDDDRGKRLGPQGKWQFGPNEFLIEPVATPTIGELFARAYQMTGEQVYLDRAIETARVLAWIQNNRGGWHRQDTLKNYDPNWEYPRRPLGRMVLDDDVTQGSLSFLMKLDQAYSASWLTESITLGLNGMLTAQHSSGGWPQEWPTHPQRPYSAFMTFNDGTINDCIRVMLEAYDQYRDTRYMDAAVRAADYILSVQLSEPHPGWAQQYDLQGRPAQARTHEPPAICSSVTGRNIETLIEIAVRTGDERYLLPIPAAERWLRRVNIGNNIWARFYELGTNRAIYVGSNGRIYYRLEDIPKKYQMNYNWQGRLGIPRALETAREVQRLGLRRYSREVNAGLSDHRRNSTMRRLDRVIRESWDVRCDLGFWRMNNGRIASRYFNNRFDQMLRYLELTGPITPDPEVADSPDSKPQQSEERILQRASTIQVIRR